ncbi:hypothetical protein BD414DRAFT_420566 [Trametes punicea]|nr:hypothetical protein BD414DRAFT_420566 [Trametes punicea]
MHLACLNLPDLFLTLWRGTIKGSTQSNPKNWECAIFADQDRWTSHGHHVACAMAYLPGFFDRAPQNIAEKVNSGYKAVEYLTWFYRYAPAMLRGSLPESYWLQLCKLVRGVLLLYGEEILPSELVESKQCLTAAVEDYERLYYARDLDRLHVVRPCLHNIWHGPDQIVLLGSLIGCTQLPMERLIGDLGSEIKQPSNPYANLSQRAFRRCQVNAVKAMMPEVNSARQKAGRIPPRSEVLGDGYFLLPRRDRYMTPISQAEAAVFYDYLDQHEPAACEGQTRETFSIRIRRWARLRLPNETVARSSWKEHDKPLNKLRMARCVKFCDESGNIEIGEVRYYCIIGETDSAVALISIFGRRDDLLYARSFKTVALRQYRGMHNLKVIDIKAIRSIVGMVPDLPGGCAGMDPDLDHIHLHVNHFYFVVEKLGFEAKVLLNYSAD